MFEFEKSAVYQKAEELNSSILLFLKNNKKFEPYLETSLRKALISVATNIAQAISSFVVADKIDFYIQARSAVYEAAAILKITRRENVILPEEYTLFSQKLLELAKLLTDLIYEMTEK